MVKPVTFGNFVRGVDASAGVLTQPRGTVPRASNLLLTKRGSLHTCDGSGILHAFNGVPTAGRGKMMADFLFAPTGVSRYYLAVAKALDFPVLAVRNPTATISAGGSLTSGTTYFYQISAIDGAGGETFLSQEVSATPSGGNLSVTLTWNVAPNAQGYNVYRATVSHNEVLLAGAGLPVAQVAPGTLTVTFIDTGAASPVSISITSAIINSLVATTYTATFTASTTAGLAAGPFVIYVPGSNALFGTTWHVTGVVSGTQFTATHNGIITGLNVGSTTTGGSLTINSPSSDTTQQTALFAMPAIAGSPAQLPVSYSNANIVALFPADLTFIDGGGGGGSGGGGGTGGGGSQGGGTPSGGVPGNVSFIPNIKQFTNQAVLALGNGFPVQVFSDPTTLVNPATVAAISSISADAFGVVTVTTATAHGIQAAQVGGNVVIAGVTDTSYNFVGPTIQIVDPTHYKVRNVFAAGHAASSGGTSTTTALPLISTFLPAFPTWTTAVAYSVNSIVQPTPNTNNIFFKAIQGGTSGGAQPGAFTTQTAADKGKQVADNNIIWVNQGSTNSTAPPPPGAAHIEVYAGSLWAWDTSPTSTATGLDGPTSLRMSDVNNLNSWNPVNQAFLDKDDGTEGMGLATFTITAQGIPPQGSLVAFKLYATYQIVGVFGSASFSIQRGETDMGCVSPRTILFIPGFGIGRLTHLGVAVFDTVNDRIISEQVRPYLFPLNDTDVSDITVMDSNWMSVAWSALTANPPMFAMFIPIGNSGGALTRALCFDLVLKGWAVVDLPFPVSCALQARTTVANPVTVLGSFSDGTIQRWQAGDVTWATAFAGSNTPAQVIWSGRSPTVSSKDPDTRLYCRRIVLRGYVDNSAPTTLQFQPRVAGVLQATQTVPLLPTGDVMKQAAVGITHDRFDVIVSGQGQITIDAFDFHVVPKPVGVLAGQIC